VAKHKFVVQFCRFGVVLRGLLVFAHDKMY
jgi:hypothetical protein